MSKITLKNNDIVVKLRPYLPSESEESEIDDIDEFEYNRKIIILQFIKQHKIDPSCINKNNLELRRLEDIALQDFFHITLTRGQQQLLDNLKKKSIFRKYKRSENSFIHEQVPFTIKTQRYNLDNFPLEQLNREIEQITRVEIETSESPEELLKTAEKVSSEECKVKAKNSSTSSQTPKKSRFRSIKKGFVSFFHSLGYIFSVVFFHLFVVSIVAIPFGLGIFFFYYVPVIVWTFYVLLFLFMVSLVICPIGGISLYFKYINKLRRNHSIGQTA